MLISSKYKPMSTNPNTSNVLFPYKKCNKPMLVCLADGTAPFVSVFFSWPMLVDSIR